MTVRMTEKVENLNQKSIGSFEERVKWTMRMWPDDLTKKALFDVKGIYNSNKFRFFQKSGSFKWHFYQRHHHYQHHHHRRQSSSSLNRWGQTKNSDGRINESFYHPMGTSNKMTRQRKRWTSSEAKGKQKIKCLEMYKHKKKHKKKHDQQTKRDPTDTFRQFAR